MVFRRKIYRQRSNLNWLQLWKNTQTTWDSASSVTTWAKLFLRCSPGVPDLDSVRCLRIKLCQGSTTSSMKKSEAKNRFSIENNFLKTPWLMIESYWLCSLKVTEDGKEALMTLSEGDMRRVLNVLQSTWLAYGSVTEENVYNCVGHPLPVDIKNIINWLLNEPFMSAYNSILFN